jgi:hypothetical protein
MTPDDPRDVLRSIAYGSDDRIAPGDRVRAIERLAELERSDTRNAAEGLSPEQVAEELASWADMADAARAVAAGPSAVEPPDERVAELEETLAVAMELNERLEAEIRKLTIALQVATAGRLLPPAPTEAEALLS